MSDPGVPAAAPITAVLFDFHSTLTGFGDPRGWLARAWSHAGRRGTPSNVLGEGQVHRLTRLIRGMGEELNRIAADSDGDLSGERHREVFHELAVRLEWIDDDLAHAMYDTMLETCIPYDDAVPTLTTLRERGIAIGLVSNLTIDVRPLLASLELAHLFDAIVLSHDIGADEQRGAVFQRALDDLGVDAGSALMVGDNWDVDSSAAAIGIRTLLLPPTPQHSSRQGLGLVLRMVG